MPQSNVVVFGYDELLLAALDVVRGAGLRTRAVVFPANRLIHAHVGKVRSLVQRRGLPTLVQPRRRDVAPFVAELADMAPDLILVWSYSMILPPTVVSLPRFGAVNVHLGLLPEYRGAHGLVWSLVNGEPRTGVTLHYMEETVDSGPIIDRATFPIRAEDDIVSLLRKSRTAGQMLLQQWLPRLLASRVAARPQDESRARYYPPRTAADARIDWSADHVTIWNVVRALVPPFPGAVTSRAGRRVVVRRARAVPCRDAQEPGIVYDVTEHGVYVAAGRGAVVLEAVEIDGHAYAAAELLSAGFRPGERLGSAEESVETRSGRPAAPGGSPPAQDKGT